MKSVVIVVKYFPTISETFIVNQINSLINAGFRIQLFAYNKGSETIIHDSLLTHDLIHTVNYFLKPSRSKIKRVSQFFNWLIKHFRVLDWLLLFKVLNFFKYGKDAYTLKLFFESQWFLIPRNLDLIHAHFGMNGNRIAYLKSHGIISQDVPLITTFHGYDLLPHKEEYYKRHYSYLLKEAAAFTVNTPYLAGLLKPINAYNRPCYILPVGLDTNLFTPQRLEKDNSYFNILFCGKLIPLKGPDIAITIVELLHDRGYKNVRLKIIGNGGLLNELKSQVLKKGLLDSIEFFGSQSQNEVLKHMDESDIFILPGRHDPETGRAETQGLVIQEAQAMELPVIVPDVGGMSYGLIDGVTGFVVKESNVEGFSKCIEKLILDKELKLQMGRRGRQFVKKFYDIRVLFEKLLRIYY